MANNLLRVYSSRAILLWKVFFDLDDLLSIHILTRRKIPMSHSVLPMKKNPTNIPNIPPTFPTNSIPDMVRYSFLTILNGSSDLKSLVWDGTPNFKPKVDWFVFSCLDHAVSSHLYSRIWQELGQCFCLSNLRLFKTA